MSEYDPEKQTSDASPDNEEGVQIGMGEPNSFEPEEDPDAAEPEGATPE